MLKRAAPMVIAAALVLGYATFFAPLWGVHLDDELEYIGLAHGIAERGEFTRADVGDAFVPEPLRLPGYPMFVAGICVTIGCDGWRLALVQGLLFLLMLPLVGVIARRVDPRIAGTTVWLVVLYLPFAYYAARAESDFFAAFVLVAATAMYCVTLERRSAAWGLAFGAVCAWLALTRPVFLAAPAAFAVGSWGGGRAAFGMWRSWAFAAIAFVALIAPVLAYQVEYFGGPTGSSGTLLWLGYMQGRQGPPDAVARYERASIAGAPRDEIVELGGALGLDAEEAVVGAEVKRRVTAFESASDRLSQAYAFVDLDRYLRAEALHLIAHDPAGWLARGVTVRSVELWIGDDPFRLPRAAAPAWLALPRLAARIAIALFALVGIVAAVRSGKRRIYLPLALIACVWLTAFPFWTEGRYSLPVVPFLLMAAVIGVRHTLRRER